MFLFGGTIFQRLEGLRLKAQLSQILMVQVLKSSKYLIIWGIYLFLDSANHQTPLNQSTVLNTAMI